VLSRNGRISRDRRVRERRLALFGGFAVNGLVEVNGQSMDRGHCLEHAVRLAGTWPEKNWIVLIAAEHWDTSLQKQTRVSFARFPQPPHRHYGRPPTHSTTDRDANRN